MKTEENYTIAFWAIPKPLCYDEDNRGKVKMICNMDRSLRAFAAGKMKIAERKHGDPKYHCSARHGIRKGHK